MKKKKTVPKEIPEIAKALAELVNEMDKEKGQKKEPLKKF